MNRKVYYYAGEEIKAHKLSWIIGIFVLLFIASVLVLSIYMFFDTSHDVNISRLDVMEDTPDEVLILHPEPIVKLANDSSELPPDIESSHATADDRWTSLLEINGDIVGWITVSGTDIDYPVMQTGNNTDYLTLDFYHNYSVFGTPFIDYRCSLHPKSKNIVIYGHSVNGTDLMGQLHNYLNQQYYDENRVIGFDTLSHNTLYEIIAVCLVHTTGTDIIDYTRTDFFHPDMLIAYVDAMIAASQVTTTTQYSAEDYYLTIQTCSKHYDDVKLVVLAKEVLR
ncbi:MAG: class B sortase [Oscillospiraceae bacterium]|nr:class B sortase [Oscillospiraceae bacterium]